MLTRPSGGNRIETRVPREAAGLRLFWPWVLLSLACLVMMWTAPGNEVVPFHLIWIGFALAYGFDPWPVPLSLAALTAATVMSGAILLLRAHRGVIAWEETTEILLMAALALLMLWHVQRRLAAVRAVTRVAEDQVATARQRERLARLTSHEMRTPLTLASGYVDLLLGREDRPDFREDLLVVRDELGRLDRAGDRCLRTITLADQLPDDALDLADLVGETVARWSTVADRTWVDDAQPVHLVASSERLRACLDTLIENAVRYTTAGDTIRVFCGPGRPGTASLGVADSGVGFSEQKVGQLNSADGDAWTDDWWPLGAEGPDGQTGYGLGIVKEIITARRGTVRAGRAPEGGALVEMILPIH